MLLGTAPCAFHSSQLEGVTRECPLLIGPSKALPELAMWFSQGNLENRNECPHTRGGLQAAEHVDREESTKQAES